MPGRTADASRTVNGWAARTGRVAFQLCPQAAGVFVTVDRAAAAFASMPPALAGELKKLVARLASMPRHIRRIKILKLVVGELLNAWRRHQRTERLLNERPARLRKKTRETSREEAWRAASVAYRDLMAEISASDYEGEDEYGVAYA